MTGVFRVIDTTPNARLDSQSAFSDWETCNYTLLTVMRVCSDCIRANCHAATAATLKWSASASSVVFTFHETLCGTHSRAALIHAAVAVAVVRRAKRKQHSHARTRTPMHTRNMCAPMRVTGRDGDDSRMHASCVHASVHFRICSRVCV